MAGMSINTDAQQEDYIDQLSRILPWHRSLTSHERLLIVILLATFVTLVGCTLFCFVCSRTALRRRYYSKRKLDKEQRILISTTSGKDPTAFSPPPTYDSIIKKNDSINFNKLNKNRYLDLVKNSSFETASDSDGILSNGDGYHLPSSNRRSLHSQSARSSLSNGGTLSTTINTYPLPPFVQVNIELNFDTTKNLLIIRLINCEHVLLHPAFDEQAEYFIHIQLINNKMLKKFNDVWKKRQSSLQLNAWKQQHEKTTRKLSRMSNNTLNCDEYLQFEINKDDITSTSLRFLFFCVDRASVQDLMCEATLRLNSSMMSNYQQIIEFKDLPQITFAEIFLGISYLPTAERFTIKINKLRYFCKIEKDQKIDARLIATFFHHGRRFYQKKLPSIIFDSSIANVYEIKDTITQNVPQDDIQSIYVHFELIMHIIDSKNESIISCGTILLGEHTRYESDWQKMLDQPRQTHLGWYSIFWIKNF